MFILDTCKRRDRRGFNERLFLFWYPPACVNRHRMDSELDERLVKLETKAAYQEVATTDSSKAVYELEMRVARLEGLVKKMAQQLKQVGVMGDDSPNQKPPHY